MMVAWLVLMVAAIGNLPTKKLAKRGLDAWAIIGLWVIGVAGLFVIASR